MVNSVYEQLHQNPGALRGTLQHARYLQHLNVVLAEHLDPTLAQHCQLANVRAETAVIQADSPVWAAKLRYQIPTILELLNTCGFIAKLTHTTLTHIQLRVRPAYQSYTGPTLGGPYLSPRSAELLRSVADTTPDPRLKRALSRLSRRQRDPG